MGRRIQQVLIANRGEIAVRIARTLQQMGIRAVGIYSEPDRSAPHVTAADEAYPLEGKTSAETYLRGDKIIEIAKAHGVDAIHPGYGFLSENAAFGQACANEGLTFIGPTPEVIRRMGDKLEAKKVFAEAGVPVVPGWSGDASGKDALQPIAKNVVQKPQGKQSRDRQGAVLHAAPEPLSHGRGSDQKHIATEADKIGYPILIKAAAGGGGKGMRVVRAKSELENAIESAQREAQSAFGDGRVFLEKFIERPRHVEIQIFGDQHGNVVHLFERECSIQRRHQKIVEESPSPALTPDLRNRMGEAAVRAAKAIGYTNAGTVEFMVDFSGSFYFLEVNTRLQVEHPVTEMVTGHDLVRAQILVAAGNPLPFTQSDLTQTGHAIECRIYAEDAASGFLPSTGTLAHFVPPVGPNIRVDSGVARGSEVSVYYDPMLAKLIVWGRTREEAIARMNWALDHFVIMGVTTNIEFLRNLMDHPNFRAGNVHTQFLQEQSIPTTRDGAIPDAAWVAAALVAQKASVDRHHKMSHDGTSAERLGPWVAGTPWRIA